MMEIAKNHLVASYLQAEQIQGDMLTTYGGLLSGYGCSYCDFKDICEGYQAFNQKNRRRGIMKINKIAFKKFQRYSRV